jgi:hypothetical protein
VARTAISITDVGNQGSVNPVSWSAADATNDMMFANDGRIVLLVDNASGGGVDVDVISVADEAGRTQDISVTVAAGNQAAFGPFHSGWWNQSGTDAGNVYVNFDVDTSITVAALRLTFR